MFGVIGGNYESWEVMLFHWGEGLRAGIFRCVGFTFSVLVFCLVAPWYPGLLQLLHCLFNE